MAHEPTVVLAVDDEPAVLVITAARLYRAGYTVLEAAGGHEALRVLESRDDVSVIVSDCNMPGMKGTELARIAQARWPHIRFIATSGHPPDPDLPDGTVFIQKPYRAEVLLSTLERVLPSR
jgi:CheY-like chemotaxis protein